MSYLLLRRLQAVDVPAGFLWNSWFVAYAICAIGFHHEVRQSVGSPDSTLNRLVHDSLYSLRNLRPIVELTGILPLRAPRLILHMHIFCLLIK